MAVQETGIIPKHDRCHQQEKSVVAALSGRVDRQRKLRDVAALGLGDLADALLVDLVDSNDRVHWQVASLDALEFRLDLFLGRVEHDGTAFTEHELFDFDETEERTVTDFAGVDLVDLALVHECDFEKRAF